MLFHLYLLGKVSKKRLLGTARVLAYGTVVSLGLGALTVKSAVANVSDESLQLGRKLAGLQDLVHGAQEFRLNGESVFFASSKVDDTVPTVLDRFEKHCTGSRAFDPLTWKALAGENAKEADEKLEERGVSKFGVLRKEDPNEHDGVVMCFTKDNGGPGNFLMGLQKFAQSGDLHDLGDVRYVHAVRNGARTFVQTMWTDGSFNVRKIMGTPGVDSPGTDFVSLPRPMHATRMITAEALNTPYAARIYDSTDAPDAVLQNYADKMFAQGWSAVTSPDVSAERMGFDGRYFIKPETAEQAVVSVTKDKETGHTQVVVASVANIPTTDHLKVKGTDE